MKDDKVIKVEPRAWICPKCGEHGFITDYEKKVSTCKLCNYTESKGEENPISGKIILLGCPKCDYVQEERKDYYEENIRLNAQNCKAYPYICNKCQSTLVKLETFEQMKERHEDEIDKLQRVCPHPKSENSDWLEHWWAPGHSSDFVVKICCICHKDVDMMLHCYNCGKSITNWEWIRGGGDNTVFSDYCKDCWEKIEDTNKRIISPKEVK